MIKKSGGILDGGKGCGPQCSVCLTTFATTFTSDYYNPLGPMAQMPLTCPICEVAKKAGVEMNIKRDVK